MQSSIPHAPIGGDELVTPDAFVAVDMISRPRMDEDVRSDGHVSHVKSKPRKKNVAGFDQLDADEDDAANIEEWELPRPNQGLGCAPVCAPVTDMMKRAEVFCSWLVGKCTASGLPLTVYLCCACLCPACLCLPTPMLCSPTPCLPPLQTTVCVAQPVWQSAQPAYLRRISALHGLLPSSLSTSPPTETMFFKTAVASAIVLSAVVMAMQTDVKLSLLVCRARGFGGFPPHSLRAASCPSYPSYIPAHLTYPTYRTYPTCPSRPQCPMPQGEVNTMHSAPPPHPFPAKGEAILDTLHFLVLATFVLEALNAP